MTDGLEWPSFPTSLLEAPAEEWGSLPGKTVDANGYDEDAESTRLLAEVQEAFDGSRGEGDLRKTLETIQMFLAVRRVRLLEDLMLLSTSTHGSNSNRKCSDEMQRYHALDSMTALEPSVDGPAAAAALLQRQLASAKEDLRPLLGVSGRSVANGHYRRPQKPETINPLAMASLEDGANGEARSERILLTVDGIVEEGLREAAGVSTEAFFGTWAERFGGVIVPLGDGGGEGGEDGRSLGKDDREIQAARDIERDTLLVNGVLVVGSEGYSAVVGRVKRELGLLAEPVAGADMPPVAGVETQKTSEILEAPLRPFSQLENFSKLVLKAANRTESGGLSFDAIHRIMSLCPGIDDGSVLVVPDSSKAEPLAITIAAEGFTEKGDTPLGSPDAIGVPEMRDGVHTFGICACVEAVTVYSLYSADMEHVHLRLRATFRNHLKLPLSPVLDVNCEAFRDVGYRGEQGEVELEVLEGPHKSQH